MCTVNEVAAAPPGAGAVGGHLASCSGCAHNQVHRCSQNAVNPLLTNGLDVLRCLHHPLHFFLLALFEPTSTTVGPMVGVLRRHGSLPSCATSCFSPRWLPAAHRGGERLSGLIFKRCDRSPIAIVVSVQARAKRGAHQFLVDGSVVPEAA